MDPPAPDPQFPDALRASKQSSLLADVTMDWCTPEELPEVPRRLLVHEGDMTSALENFHRGFITLEVLQARREGGVYHREVVLRKDETGEAVEYGLIEIELEVFEGEMQAAILEGGKPLGGLLNATGMGYRSAPLGFFRVPAGKLAAIFPPGSGGEVLFGRYNQLFTAGGDLFARIIEILPDTPEP